MLETKKASKLLTFFVKYGAPGTIRTCDRLVRSQVLYPAELRALNLRAGIIPTWTLSVK